MIGMKIKSTMQKIGLWKNGIELGLHLFQYLFLHAKIFCIVDSTSSNNCLI